MTASLSTIRDSKKHTGQVGPIRETGPAQTRVGSFPHMAALAACFQICVCSGAWRVREPLALNAGLQCAAWPSRGRNRRESVRIAERGKWSCRKAASCPPVSLPQCSVRPSRVCASEAFRSWSVSLQNHVHQLFGDDDESLEVGYFESVENDPQIRAEQNCLRFFRRLIVYRA